MEWLADAFLEIWDRSYQTCLVILAVLVVRLLLKKVDKRITTMVWIIPFFRLGFPIRLKSYFSILPKSNLFTYNELVNSTEGITVVPSYSTSTFSYIAISDVGQHVSENALDVIGLVINVCSVIWVVGFILLLAYSLIALAKLKVTLKTAIILEKNVYESEKISSPFIVGFIRPKIYLPTNVDDKEKELILKHERSHIKRYDYVKKPLIYLVTMIHWFNPFVWYSYFLYVRDMEQACDEQVLLESNVDIKKDYSQTILNFASRENKLRKVPLAFSENSTKTRIKSILTFKKAPIWILIVCFIMLFLTCIVLIADKTDLSFSERFLKENNNRLLDNNTLALIDDEEFIWAVLDQYKNTDTKFPITRKSNTTFLKGKEVINQFENDKENIKAINKNEPVGAIDYVIYLDDLGSAIFFYEDKETIEIEEINTKRYVCYKIPQTLYDDLFFTMSVQSYLLPSELTDLVFNGLLTNETSTNDTPVNVEYMSFQFGDLTYYIYQKGNQYFCERPYVFIKEISQETYERGYHLLTQPKTLGIHSIDEIEKLEITLAGGNPELGFECKVITDKNEIQSFIDIILSAEVLDEVNEGDVRISGASTYVVYSNERKLSTFTFNGNVSDIIWFDNNWHYIEYEDMTPYDLYKQSKAHITKKYLTKDDE